MPLRASLFSVFPAYKAKLRFILFLILGMALWDVAAQAQTAHFSYSMTPVGGGFSTPLGVAVDARGNFYVADSGSQTVKEIPVGCNSTSCELILVTGFFSTPHGIAVDASGNVYVADPTKMGVYEIPANCTSSCSATALNSSFPYVAPTGVAVDASGNVYVADPGGNAVYEMPPNCTVSCSMTTLGGVSAFSGPLGVAVDAGGNVYVADTGNSAVKQMPAGCTTSSCVTTLGVGFAFNSPSAITVDASGILYVASGSSAYEMPSNCASSGCVTTLTSGFVGPTGVAVDGNSNVYVADSGSAAVWEVMQKNVNFFSGPVGATGTRTLNFTFDTGGTIGAPVALTQGVAGLDLADAGTGSCDTNGTSHSYNAGDTCTVDVTLTASVPGLRMGVVELVNGSGTAIATVNAFGTGTGPQVVFSPSVTNILGGGLSGLRGVTVDGAGNMYVADSNNGAVKEIPVGCATSSCVVTLGGGFGNPVDVAVDGAGNVYVADPGMNAAYQIPPGCASSSCVTSLGGGFNQPKGVAVDGTGNVYVVDTNNGMVKEMPASCTSPSCVTTIAGGFNSPEGLAIDSAGNLYVTDDENSSVAQLPAGCASTSCATTLGGGFSHPDYVAVDPSGNVYVADSGKGAVYQIPAGCGSSSCVTALGGSFNLPMGVAADGNGNIYVGNYGNTAVQQIQRATPPSLTFASTGVGATSNDSPQTVTLQNIGNAALTFPVLTSGQNPSIAANFQIDNSATCPVVSSSSSAGTLAAGASCTLPVDFAPTTTGSIGGSLVVTDNHLNAAAPNYSTQTISLSGTGVAVPTATAAVASESLTQNFVAASFTPVTGSGGTGALSYSISPALPAGLTLSASAGAISGTPTVASAATTYTITVTDSNSMTATANFSLTVNQAVTATTAVASTSLTQNYAAGFTPVTASGGTGALSYGVSPVLPAGLSLNTSTGAISGTPTATSAATTYTITVTDSNSATATANFSLMVNQTVIASTQLGSVLLTQNHAAPVVIPVTGLEGTGALSYSVSPALPAGLNLSASTGAISGTPTVASVGAVYTITVTDSNSATASADFSLTVNAAVTATTGVASTSLTQNHAAPAFTPVMGSGGTGTLSYSVSPVLPAGLSLNTSTGVISGTPTVASAAASYIVTLTDSNGASATANFSLAVSATVTATTAVASESLAYNTPANYTPVTASGGTGTLSYSVSPALPAGLSFNSATGAISGTPTATSAAASYAVTVTDSNNATASANFMLAVTAATPVLSWSAPASVAYGTALSAMQLNATASYNGSAVQGSFAYTPALGAVLGIGTHTLSATFTPADTTNYSAPAAITTSLTVTGAMLNVTANNGQRVYGAVNPAFSGTITGALNNDSFTESFTTTATQSSPTGSYAIVPNASGANLSNYTVQYNNGILTVTPAGTTTSLAASSNSLTSGQNLTLTAQVASATTGTPTGTVSFYNGTTLLGTAALANGSASYSTSSLAGGASYSLTAVYSGDANFTTSNTSSATTVAVATEDFSLTPASGTQQSETVAPGVPATFTFQVSPNNGTYPGVVIFTATGLPPGATATFSPATLPANSGAQAVTLTVQTPFPTAKKSNPFEGEAPIALGLLLPMLGLRRLRRKLLPMLTVVVTLCGLMFLSGCGSSTSSNGQAPANYNITVTVASGQASHSFNVQLNVE